MTRREVWEALLPMLLVGGVMHKKRSVDLCRLPKPGEIGIFDRSPLRGGSVVRGAPGEPRPADASEGGEGRAAWTRRYRKIIGWEPYPGDVLAHMLMGIDPRYPTVSTRAVPRAIQGRGGGASMPWADGQPR